MITIELNGIDVGFAKNAEGGMASLAFVDAQSGIRVVVPFDDAGWAKFKRHVEADGNLPAILLARPDLEKNGRGAV